MRDETSHELGSSALHMLHRASQAADEMFANETTGADLTPRQFAVLAALELLESASQTQIVDLTGIDRSTLADIVKRLVKRGLLNRRRSRSDARAYVVRLTPEGRSVLIATKPAALRVEERLMEHLPHARRTELIAALEAIIHDLEEGQVSLGDALARYEEGVKHLKHCYEFLATAENVIACDHEWAPLRLRFRRSSSSRIRRIAPRIAAFINSLSLDGGRHRPLRWPGDA